jgi:hypothetical protein
MELSGGTFSIDVHKVTLLGAGRVNQGMACANQHDIQINLRRIDPLALIRLGLR